MRTDFASVQDYFDGFLLKEPQGKILEGKVNIGEGWASDTGIYEVSFDSLFQLVSFRSFLWRIRQLELSTELD